MCGTGVDKDSVTRGQIDGTTVGFNYFNRRVRQMESDGTIRGYTVLADAQSMQKVEQPSPTACC